MLKLQRIRSNCCHVELTYSLDLWLIRYFAYCSSVVCSNQLCFSSYRMSVCFSPFHTAALTHTLTHSVPLSPYLPLSLAHTHIYSFLTPHTQNNVPFKYWKPMVPDLALTRGLVLQLHCMNCCFNSRSAASKKT